LPNDQNPSGPKSPDQVRGRSFRTALSAESLSSIQTGSLQALYRGLGFLKSPFDVALYLQLIGRLRPATIIEIGTKHGGSALWFADQMTAHGISARVVSLDLSPPTGLADARIQFVAGDAHDLSGALTHDVLASLPHPWLVSEDSAHTFEACSAVLRFFDTHLVVGDYIVIEDGVLSDMVERHYETYQHGPNRAVEKFLSEHGDSYEIDGTLCDFFGHNVTWNPNAWLRRSR
jgi:cephalosporin hydroxylase